MTYKIPDSIVSAILADDDFHINESDLEIRVFQHGELKGSAYRFCRREQWNCRGYSNTQFFKNYQGEE